VNPPGRDWSALSSGRVSGHRHPADRLGGPAAGPPDALRAAGGAGAPGGDVARAY
jgi:hypothetical protein